MFNISDQQTNYHTIEVDGERMEFLTGVEHSKFSIRETKLGGFFLVIGLLGLAGVFVFLGGWGILVGDDYKLGCFFVSF